jgi:uncharacterized protein YdbL (DUF1318 family)
MRPLRLLALSLAGYLTFSAAAFALDLATAKSSGLVGETPSGYIAAITVDGETTALVNEVNTRRREVYLQISNGNGQPLSVVEKLAAQKIYGELRSGEYFRDPSGAWQRK